MIVGRPRLLALLGALALLVGQALFVALPARTEDEPPPGIEPLEGSRILWSSTLLGQLKGIESPQDDDGRGGFFDKYEFTANKDPSVALELGVREASLDWIEDRAPLLQIRYESPTSNLGVTGSDFDNAFFNQRAIILGRQDAFQLDFDYRRLRTEQLRAYPETEAGGGALPFTDLTGRNARFYRERTGFQTELRWRPEVTLGDRAGVQSGLAPELSLRGGYDRRESRLQQRAILNPGNDWLAFSNTRGDDVSDVGVGLVVAPGGLFTLSLDFDYEEFDSANPRLDDSLPFSSTSRSVAFVPSTDRWTGKAFLQGRFGDRAVVTAGFQATLLEQERPSTPLQRASGFGDNQVLVYSAQFSGDLRVTRDISASAFVRYVRRDNDIDRSSALFTPANGTQVDEFLDTYDRIDMGGEALWRATRRSKLAIGARMLWIDRDLDFAALGLANQAIQPENALVDHDTLMWTFYARGDLRPLPRLGLRSELSYRISPRTGYVTDLDGYFKGEVRATYALPIERPATLSAYVRGGIGDNSDFSFVGGLAPNPPGPTFDRDYQRSHWNLGLSGDVVWREDLTLFGSIHFARDRQSDKFVLSDVQRYFQESVPIVFRSPGDIDFQSNELGLLVGGRVGISRNTDASIAGSYTRAEAAYDDSDSARSLDLIDDNRVVEANIYGLDLELRHRIREGLRVFAGYRLQYFSDGAPKPGSPSSVRQPPDRSDVRHTVSFGITLNGDLLADHR